MQIWIDADACPKVIKDIIYKTANRLHIQVTLVTNQPFKIPHSAYIDIIQVPNGFDAADEKITEQINQKDLVITEDIPLANAIIKSGAFVLSPRGKMYTEDNIGESLTMRNFKDELRGTGVNTGGPTLFKASNREAFANQLDRFLTKQLKSIKE